MRTRDGLPPGSGNEAYDFLRFHPSPQPRHRDGQVSVYADETGALKQIDPEGVESAIGAGGGASPVALLGPFGRTFTEINAASGTPIALSGPLEIGTLVEPFAFFPTFFDGGSPDNTLFLGVLRPPGSLVTGEAVQFDGNAPPDEDASYGVSGLYAPAGGSGFPRRAVYRIKEDGCKLGLGGPLGLTRGEIIAWAFVWTP